MVCSLLGGRREREREKKEESFSTDKSNYSPRTSLPGTKLLFSCQDSKQVVEMGLRVSAALWSILSLFKISTVASLFPSRAVVSSSSSDRKLCGLGTPFQGPWTAALKQEALDDGLILFRSLNKCLLGRLAHSCACLTTITSWAEQAIQLGLCKGQDERGAAAKARGEYFVSSEQEY